MASSRKLSVQLDYLRKAFAEALDYELTNDPDTDDAQLVDRVFALAAAKRSASQMGAAGGRARATALSPQRRSAIAKRAAQARWNKRRVVGRQRRKVARGE